ncbi:MAG TPA: amidohydrolase family protein [Kofleriaceae bacterium]|nr:amidohydrolase family protein [Kofleriaceae bacterium]
MHRCVWLWVVAYGCGSASGPAAPVPAVAAPPASFVAQAGDTAFTDVSVVPMTSDGALAHHTVVVRGDRIVAVAPRASVEVPPGVRVIDGAGKWLMPGLADMHVHAWQEDELAMFLAAGVTTIRNMWGVPMHVVWRSEIARGERLGPTIVTAGALIDGAPPDWPGSVVLTSPEAAEPLVVAQKAAGYDFLKPVNRLTPAAYRALAAAGERHGMTMSGHVAFEGGLDGALAARQRSIEHVDGYLQALVPPGVVLPDIDDAPAWTRAVLANLDPARLPGLIERTVAAGTWNCPTLIAWDRAPELHDAAELGRRVQWLDKIPAARRARWVHQFESAHPTAEDGQATRALNAQVAKVVAALDAAHAPILVGTDSGISYVVPGESLHEEIELLVAAGVPRPHVLRAATAEAWRYLGQPHEAGVVEVGARADLLLLASNPLSAPLPLIPDGVMVRGRWLPRAELASRLAEVARHDAPPGARWAAAPPLSDEAAHAAQYDIAIAGTPVAAERLAIVGAGTRRAIVGEMIDPGSDLETTYRLAADRATIRGVYHTMTVELAASLTAGALVVTGADLAGVPVSLRAPLPAGVFLAGPGIGGTLALVERLAGMKPGARRTLASLELVHFPAVAITPVRYQVERKPDVDGHRVFRVATTRAEATVASELTVDRDGLLVGQSDGPPADTITTRRTP